MQYRLFNTPFITPFLRILSAITLKVWGWKVIGEAPTHVKKYVAIVAPHTSNWDFPILLMTSFILRLDVHWMGKHTLFRFPFRGLMTWFGGIPIDRRVRGDMVAKAVAMFNASERLAIGMSPEGTRKATTEWRTGFWYMAHGANVPIYLAFIDYKTKSAGMYAELRSSGNVETDMEWIKHFYSGFEGKHPHNFKI